MLYGFSFDMLNCPLRIEKDKDNYTSALLEQVVTRLTVSARGFIITDKEKKEAETIRDHFLEKVSEARPNDVELLFALTDYILVQYNACAAYVEEDRRFTFEAYKSGTRVYLYLNHILEISILSENDVKSTTKYHYICFSFPEGKHIYHVEEIPVTQIPSFADGEKENDSISIQFLWINIAQVFDSFCIKFAESGKFRSKEYSCCGIKPVFSDTTKYSDRQPSKKRKKTIPVHDMTKFELATPIFYKRLSNVFEKMESKPDAHSRLFAVLLEILTSACACKISMKKDEWPGLTYGSEVTQVWFPSRMQSSELRYHIFTISLLKNDTEYYCCLRFTEDHNKKCIKKLDDTLVPTFITAETRKDVERIHNLSIWLSAIVKSFVQKVIAGSYSSENISFVSLTSTTSQSRDEASSDVD